jgi:hypothetical protein
MSWLTRKNTKDQKAVPIKTKSGEVVFRRLPLKTGSKWIHPSVYKFNFIEQGVEKGRVRAIRRASFYLTQRIKKRADI